MENLYKIQGNEQKKIDFNSKFSRLKQKENNSNILCLLQSQAENIVRTAFVSMALTFEVEKTIAWEYLHS